MRVPNFLFCVCMIGFVVVWFIPAKGEPTTAPSRAQLETEIVTLKKQVKQLDSAYAELQEQNEKLRAQIKELKARGRIVQGQLRVDPPSVTPMNPLAVPDNMPRGSVAREFNGSTYYLVPLGQEQAVTGSGTLNPVPASKAK